MRTYRKSDNLIKIIHEDRIIFVAYNYLNLVDKCFMDFIIKPTIIEQDKNYVIMAGLGINIKFIFLDNKDSFIDGCCGVFGLRLNRDEIIKHLN